MNDKYVYKYDKKSVECKCLDFLRLNPEIFKSFGEISFQFSSQNFKRFWNIYPKTFLNWYRTNKGRRHMKKVLKIVQRVWIKSYAFLNVIK